MPIDPTIFLRAYQGGADPVEQIQKAAALREQQRRGQLTDLQIQGEKMKLADMSRQQQKSLALDDAIKGAYQTPAPQTTQAAPVDVGGVSIPQPSSTVQGPPQLNQGMLLSKVGQVDPMAAMSMQSQFTKQKQDQDAATAAMMEKLSQADLNTQKSASEHLGIFGQKAMFFSQLPPDQKAQLYPSFKQDLEQNHFVPQGSLPDQYGPQVDQVMHASILEGQKVKDTLDQQLTAAGQKQTAEHNAATEAQSAATLTETKKYHNAELGMRAAELKQKNAFGNEALTPEQQDLVDQIGQGKMPLTRLDYLATRNPGVLAAVSARYPDFDGAKIKSYVDATKDFTSGKTATALNSGGTALGHLKELDDLNTNASHVPHTPAWTAYQNKAATVAAELAKFYGDATIPAINSIKDTLTATLPGNRSAAIRTQAQSMGDKIDSYEQQWKNAAPSSKYQAPMPGMSDKAKKARAALDPNYKAQSGPTVTNYKIVNGQLVPDAGN